MKEVLKLLGLVFLGVLFFPILLILFPWALIEREKMEKENFSENQLAQDRTKDVLNAKELPNAD
jgi:hypothetical protein